MDGPDLMTRQQSMLENQMLMDRLREKRENDLKDLAGKYDLEKSNTRTAVILGDFNIEMSNYVDDQHIDLVVICGDVEVGNRGFEESLNRCSMPNPRIHKSTIPQFY